MDVPGTRLSAFTHLGVEVEAHGHLLHWLYVTWGTGAVHVTPDCPDSLRAEAEADALRRRTQQSIEVRRAYAAGLLP